MSFDVTDLSTVVLRLYDAAFDRAPDAFGLADYTRALALGQFTVQQILDVFAGSGEFQARYGGLNNDQFVREMYRFSLNREGDAPGIAAYVQALNSGQFTRAQVLGIFSESAEHQQIIANQVTQTGLWIQDEATIAIARLYDTVFNRLPDLGGLRDYRGFVDQGFGLQTFADAMVQSPEFRATFGNLTNQQFVEQIYRFVLDREGDAAGVAGYVQALNNGLSRAELVVVFSESPEHRFGYQAVWDNQVRDLETGLYSAAGPEAVETKAGDGREPQVNVDLDPPIADDSVRDPDVKARDDAFVLPALSDDESVLVLPGLSDDITLDDALFDGAFLPLATGPLNGNHMLTPDPLDGFGLSDTPWDRHDRDGLLQ